jgi:predicted PurR-regulated permease PerM
MLNAHVLAAAFFFAYGLLPVVRKLRENRWKFRRGLATPFAEALLLILLGMHFLMGSH